MGSYIISIAEISSQSRSAPITKCETMSPLAAAYPGESMLESERPHMTETNGFAKPMVFRVEDFR